MTPTDQLFAHRYRLEGRLGAGGMSTVQLAFDTRLERYVAVKLLAEHLAEDSNFVARFRREALAAARLVHPNVVQVYDFGTDEASGRQFIVMEYVKGPSCAELLRDRGRLPADEAVEIVGQACRGLDYAHRNGVVHRDVKPGNLLRNPDGVIKLADFGIAKAAEDSDITRIGSVLGTAAYLSPEQAHGEPAGPTSDLYALGVVAYQLMTGRLPYDAGSLTELARQQELGGPPALSDVDPAIPPAVSAAVARALERHPLARYASAAEMESALRDAQRGIAPAPAEEATRALGQRGEAGGGGRRPKTDTAATRMLDRTGTGAAAVRSEAPPRRRLEPLPDSEAPPRRRPAPVAEPATPAPRTRKRRPNWARRFAALLMVGLLAALGILGYQLIAESTQRGVQLKENVEGDLRQTIDEIRDLIRDNTR